jgi:hypothetical protein
MQLQELVKEMERCYRPQIKKTVARLNAKYSIEELAKIIAPKAKSFIEDNICYNFNTRENGFQCVSTTLYVGEDESLPVNCEISYNLHKYCLSATYYNDEESDYEISNIDVEVKGFTDTFDIEFEIPYTDFDKWLILLDLQHLSALVTRFCNV